MCVRQTANLPYSCKYYSTFVLDQILNHLAIWNVGSFMFLTVCLIVLFSIHSLTVSFQLGVLRLIFNNIFFCRMLVIFKRGRGGGWKKTKKVTGSDRHKKKIPSPVSLFLFDPIITLFLTPYRLFLTGQHSLFIFWHFAPLH